MSESQQQSQYHMNFALPWFEYNDYFIQNLLSFKGTQIKSPITWYNVSAGEIYRFRVIQVGTIYPFRISVDGHSIVVVASDGFDIKPKEVESLIINSGERYDFLLYANQTTNNYWIRAVSLEVKYMFILEFKYLHLHIFIIHGNRVKIDS